MSNLEEDHLFQVQLKSLRRQWHIQHAWAKACIRDGMDPTYRYREMARIELLIEAAYKRHWDLSR